VIEGALFVIIENIQESLEHKEMAICAFLDIDGAFDNRQNHLQMDLPNSGYKLLKQTWA